MPAHAPSSKLPPRRHGLLFAVLALTIGLATGTLCFEGLLRVLELRAESRNFYEGEGGHWTTDPSWGWKPSPGTFRVGTSEFIAEGSVNAASMNDDPVSPADAGKFRIMILGDSHTFAVGVSMRDTYAKRLEALLNGKAGASRFRTYNLGMSGYNMHQYLTRLIDQGPELRPQVVVVGVSLATDLYDLLPPDRGGWIYFAGAERDYFDFDASGALTRRHSASTSATAAAPTGPPPAINLLNELRNALAHTALYRAFSRSNIALAIGSRLRIGGKSLWPSAEAVVRVDPGAEYEYNWRLFGALLKQMKMETDKLQARLVVAVIPYLPQVYDEVWDATFGGNPAYDREAGVKRIRAMTDLLGVGLVDTTPAMRDAQKRLGHWVHHKIDAHPTTEGHQAIADSLLDSGYFQ